MGEIADMMIEAEQNGGWVGDTRIDPETLEVLETRNKPYPIKIKRAQFELYEQIRKSGKTNMTNVEQVRFFSGHKLTRQHVTAIIKDYDNLKAKFSFPTEK